VTSDEKKEKSEIAREIAIWNGKGTNRMKESRDERKAKIYEKINTNQSVCRLGIRLPRLRHRSRRRNEERSTRKKMRQEKKEERFIPPPPPSGSTGPVYLIWYEKKVTSPSRSLNHHPHQQIQVRFLALTRRGKKMFGIRS
jgi:hypothetical protein